MNHEHIFKRAEIPSALVRSCVQPLQAALTKNRWTKHIRTGGVRVGRSDGSPTVRSDTVVSAARLCIIGGSSAYDLGRGGTRVEHRAGAGAAVIIRTGSMMNTL